MSDTESFESAVKAAMPLLLGECIVGECPKHCDCNQCGKEMSNRLRRAHDREIRDMAQQQYHRGFEDGKHSMDAEHRAIAMRLRALRFDGGSHENLSRIAYAIYPCATGWTCESADGLRDKLVDLMGGVSEPSVAGVAKELMDTIIKESNERLQNDGKAEKPSNTEVGDDTCDSQCRGACADCDGDDSGEQEEVTDERLADDCAVDSRGGDGGGDLHMAGLVAYDVLDNERRKAIAELSGISVDELCKKYDYVDVYPEFIWSIGQAIGLRHGAGFEEIIKRLIYLLGGDQPSGIDVLRAMDDGHSRTCPKSDEEMSENAPSVSITDELREYVDTALKMHDDVPWYGINDENEADHNVCYVTEGKLLRIADRIDEQFARVCQQQEAVLQSTIDGMVKEYEHDRLPDQLRIEKLVEQRDEVRAKLDEIRDALDG